MWKHCSNLSAFLLKTLRIKALHWWSTCKVLGRTGAVLVSAVSKLDSTYYWLNSTEFILLLCCKAQAAAAGGEMPWFADVDLLQVKQQKNSMSKRLSRTQRYLISSPVTDWTAFYFVCLSPSETLPWDSLVPACFAALAWLGESFSWPDFCWLKKPWKPPPSQILPACSNIRSDVPQSIGASAILSSNVAVKSIFTLGIRSAARRSMRPQLDQAYLAWHQDPAPILRDVSGQIHDHNVFTGVVNLPCPWMELQVVTWHHLTQKSPAARCVVNHEHMKVVSIQGGSNGVHHPILSTVPMGCWMFAQCSHLCYDWGLGGLTLTPMGMTPMGMVTSAWVEHGGPELGHWFSRSPPKIQPKSEVPWCLTDFCLRHLWIAIGIGQD